MCFPVDSLNLLQIHAEPSFCINDEAQVLSEFDFKLALLDIQLESSVSESI
jgi:hypothetical protein